MINIGFGTRNDISAFLRLHYIKTWLMLALEFICMPAFVQQVPNQVNGTLVQFNDNGAWCWFQDERAVIDTVCGRLIAGSVASGSGTGGAMRNGSVEAVIFDLNTRISKRYVLTQWINDCDDHNAPGFLVRPDGRYIAMYSRHYDKYLSHYRIFHDTLWEPERNFDWKNIPGGIDYTIAYSNLCYLSSEKRTYNFARSNHRSPNLIYSSDLGDSWMYGGQLTTNTSQTYNKGYYKYWSNGVDRIDFILTEQHPRDTSTSIYHGFIKNGKSYASDGSLADSNIFDTLDIPSFHQFTQVFADSTLVEGHILRRCWIADLAGYDDGTMAAIITGRIDNNQGGGSQNINPDHAFIYCHYDGSQWSCHYLCKAGFKMYASEQDYTGLGALCPDDPHTLYLSTPYDPVNKKSRAGFHEIYKGTTADGGLTWIWNPVTRNSEYDNFRPIVPRWDGNHVALLWWRGNYTSAQNYDAAVVGLIECRQEKPGPVHYSDANLQNTGPLIRVNHSGNFHNNTLLKTGITPRNSGIYDIWVNFSYIEGTSFSIKAGFSPEEMQIFRPLSCRGLQMKFHKKQIVQPDRRKTCLCQAYLGRVKTSKGGSFQVYIDTGGSQLPSLHETKNWSYMGISYSRIGMK